MQRTPEDIWAACLEIIRDNVNRQSFKTWFEPLKASELVEQDGRLQLTVQLPSKFYHEWLETHYFGLIRKTVARVLGEQGRLVFDVRVHEANMTFPVRPEEESGGAGPLQVRREGGEQDAPRPPGGRSRTSPPHPPCAPGRPRQDGEVDP